MGQIKSHEVDAWLARKTAPTPVVLIYGPDRGLVAERAQLYARASGVPLEDPFSVVRLDASDVERQPGRLLDEANTMPMFTGSRLIWIRNASAQKALAEDVRALCAKPPVDTLILIEAGDLKKGVGLRATVEASPAALAIPCYADDARATDAIINAELASAGLTMEPKAREVLKRNLGGDRLATRAELEKLVLASLGRKTVDLADVRALAGDASALSAEDIVDTVLAGDLAAFDRLFSTQVRSSVQTYTVLAAAQRQLQTLLAMRLTMERDGRNSAAVIAGSRPPVFFSRRQIVEGVLERWQSGELAEMLVEVHQAVLDTRRSAGLAIALTHAALTAICLSRRTARQR